MSCAIGGAPAIPGWLARAYPFQRQMAFHDNERMHFVNDGPEDGPAVLLLHGNPAWSFIWRRIIPRLTAQGYHVIAPDLVGLGLSSKPRDFKRHTLDFHVEMLDNLLEGLKLDNFVLVGQDWGGPMGAALAARTRRKVAGAVFANTYIGAPSKFRPSWFHRFARVPLVSDLAFRGLNFPVNAMYTVQSDPESIDETAIRAYHYALSSWGFRVAPLALARMVPNKASHPSVPLFQAGAEWAAKFEGPVRLVWGTGDPILGKALPRMKRLFPSAPVTETNAGHFLQEEVPGLFADAIIAVREAAGTAPAAAPQPVHEHAHAEA